VLLELPLMGHLADSLAVEVVVVEVEEEEETVQVEGFRGVLEREEGGKLKVNVDRKICV
jgi:hypothetical protein